MLAGMAAWIANVAIGADKKEMRGCNKSRPTNVLMFVAPNVTDHNADRARLTQWVHDHGGAVLGFISALVRDRHVAEDLLQEVFCRAWENRGRYQELGRERGYLLRIADRLVRDRARGSRGAACFSAGSLDAPSAEWMEPADETELPLAMLARLEAERELRSALDLLSDAQQRTLLLRYYGDLEFHEIAEQLGCAVGTALSHARRGLLTLRKLLAKEPCCKNRDTPAATSSDR